ncbi:MAG: hypothetical protein ACI96M_004194, partial [Candidatus Azotimanducaceae bacterium]
EDFLNHDVVCDPGSSAFLGLNWSDIGTQGMTSNHTESVGLQSTTKRS